MANTAYVPQGQVDPLEWAKALVKDPSKYVPEGEASQEVGQQYSYTGQVPAWMNPDGAMNLRSGNGLFGNLDDVLLGSGMAGISDRWDTRGYLDQIAQTAGLPAGFNWDKYLAAAQLSRYQQSGEFSAANPVYANPATNIKDAVALAAQDHPQLAPILPQVSEGSEFWRAGAALTGQISTDKKKTEHANNIKLLSVLAGPVAASFAPAGGASATAGFGEAAYAGGGAAAMGGGATAGGATAGAYGANAGSPTVTGTATGSGQFVNASGQALPASGGAAATLAGGSTAGGTFAPAAQGATAGAGGLGVTGTTAAGAVGTTALSRILDGSGSTADYTSVLGNVGMAAYGADASDRQTDAYKELAEKYMAMGAPYRDELAAISTDPNKFYEGPAAQEGLEAVLRRLSVNGNPAGSPYSQSLALGSLYDKYGQERDRLAGFGGLTAYNSAAPGAAATAIGSTSNTYNALGAGAADLFGARKQRSLAEILRDGGY